MSGMKKKLLLLAVALSALIISFTFFERPCGDCGLREEIKIGEAEVMAELADTPEERARGLSGREELGDGEGMLFIFDEPAVVGFWMKEMLFPIDIIWIDSYKRVIGVEKDISPATYPETFRPSEAVKYVLEVPAGFSQRHSVDTGDELYFAY